MPGTAAPTDGQHQLQNMVGPMTLLSRRCVLPLSYEGSGARRAQKISTQNNTKAAPNARSRWAIIRNRCQNVLAKLPKLPKLSICRVQRHVLRGFSCERTHHW